MTLGLASHSTDKFCGLRALSCLTELRSILQLCIVFWRFIWNLARPATQLNQKLLEYQQTTMGPLIEEGTQSMNARKEALISPPVLALPKLSGPMTLGTDAPCPGRMCNFTTLVEWKCQNRLATVGVIHWRWTRMRRSTMRISRHFMGCNAITSTSARIYIYYQDGPWLTEVNCKPFRQYLQCRRLPFTTLIIFVWRKPQTKCQASNRSRAFVLTHKWRGFHTTQGCSPTVHNWWNISPRWFAHLCNQPKQGGSHTVENLPDRSLNRHGTNEKWLINGTSTGYLLSDNNTSSSQESKFNLDHWSLSPRIVIVDGTTPVLRPGIAAKRFLYLSHHPIIAQYPG